MDYNPDPNELLDDGDEEDDLPIDEEGVLDGWQSWDNFADELSQLDVTHPGGGQDGDQSLMASSSLVPTHRRIVQTFNRYRKFSATLLAVLLYTVVLSPWTIQVLIIGLVGVYFIIVRNLTVPLVIMDYTVSMRDQFLTLALLLLPLFYASDPYFMMAMILLISAVYTVDPLREFLYTFCVELFIGIDTTAVDGPDEVQKAKHDWRVLVNLRLLTPQEVFDERLEKEDYTTALEVATEHRLDTNPLYEQQWKRSAPITRDSIDNYLARVTNRMWVVKEAINEIPADMSVARELIQFGIRQTQLRDIVLMGQKPVESDPSESSETDLESDLHRPVPVQVPGQKPVQKRPTPVVPENEADLLKNLIWDGLNLEQKQLCRWRRKLFRYADRLATYESILGGRDVAGKYFNVDFYAKFRDQTGLQAGVEFAQSANTRGLAALFTYAAGETLEHRLPLVWHFPETSHPLEYRILLPECGLYEDEPDVADWSQISLRPTADWCERFESHFRDSAGMSPTTDEFTAEFYSTNRHLVKYRSRTLTKDLLTDWITSRVRTIERSTCLLSNALALVRIGIEANVPGLDRLHDELTNFSVIIYDCDPEATVNITASGTSSTATGTALTCGDLTFDRYEPLTVREKMFLMMSGLVRRDDQLIPAIRQHLIPFLQRAERFNTDPEKSLILELLHEYLISLARRDLSLCLKVFDNSKIIDPSERSASDPGSGPGSGPSSAAPDPPVDSSRIIRDPKHLMRFALDCMYASQRTDQLEVAYAIYACLPARDDDDPERPAGHGGHGHGQDQNRDGLSSTSPSHDPVMSSLHDECDQLERHLNTLELLQTHGHDGMTLHDLRDLVISTSKGGRDGPSVVRNLFNQLFRRPLKMNDSTGFKQNDWLELFNDLQSVRENCFSDILPLDDVYEMFVETLLASGRRENFNLAASLMQLNPAVPLPRRKKLIPYRDATRLLVAAAQQVVNSCRSSSDDEMSLVVTDLFGLVAPADQQAHPDIKRELDFIEAVRLLNQDFAVDLFPIQIRLVDQPRTSLLEHALRTRPATGYRLTAKVRRLAACLRVDELPGGRSPESRDILALSMLADAAMSARDWRHAWTVCRIIMDSTTVNSSGQGQSGRQQVVDEGWQACERLAAVEEFTDLDARRQLLGYAMSYCRDPTGERLVGLIHSSARLRGRLLAGSLSRQATSGGSIAPLRAAAGQTARRVSSLLQSVALQLPITGSTTGSTGSGLGRSQPGPEPVSRPEADPPEDTTPGIPSFYADLYPDYKPSELACRYDALQLPAVPQDGNLPSAHLIQLLLRMELLDPDRTNADTVQNLLREGALGLRYNDTPLAVGYQLAADLNDGTDGSVLKKLNVKLSQ